MADEPVSQPPELAPEPATPPEAATAPEVAPAEPVVETSTAEAQTAQIPASEPLPTEPAPSSSAPEPPQAATSASGTPASPLTSSPQATHPARDLLVKARATIQDRKRKKLDKILEALTAKGKITNDEVEKLLHVSDPTATRYLSELEKEGKIKQVGKTGKAVEYTRI